MRLNMIRAIGSLVLGFAIGWGMTTTVFAQQTGTQTNPFVVTQTGGWNHQVDCDAKPVSFTLSVDGATAVAAAGVTWAGTVAPFTATIPFSQMPPAVRTVGSHSIAVTFPSTTDVLADGTVYTYPSGTLTSYVKVLPDVAVPNVPRNPRWIKIAGTVAVAIAIGVAAYLGILPR